jgi:malonate decarboxylase delta subunit
MERLEFRFTGGRALAATQARLVGVVGSGNLEVLVEPAVQGGACTIEINTVAHGFGTIWQAVMTDFFGRHPLGDVRISINDNGATPAIVSLRLDQAIEEYAASSGKRSQ